MICLILFQLWWTPQNEIPRADASTGTSTSTCRLCDDRQVAAHHFVSGNLSVAGRLPVGTKPTEGEQAISTKFIDGGEHDENTTYVESFAHTKYAYVFAIWRLDPDQQHHKGYIANILIAARILRLHGSTANFVVMIKLHYNSKHTVLPDELVQLFMGMKIQIHYLSQQKQEDDYENMDRNLNVYGTMFYKFAIFNMTQYRQVMYLDSDVLPMNNLDYLMEQADTGFLKPNIMIASNREPANGGMFIVRPNHTIYQHIQSIIHKWGDRLAKSKEWDELVGWGHVIEPPDCWESNNHRNKGINWTFWAANADQGFFYYYCKYVLKDCTQILARRIINFSGGAGDFVSVEQEWNVTSLQTSPFTKKVAPTKVYSFSSGNCGYVTSYTSPNWPGCVPPYRDFQHYTGRSKPWQQDGPVTTRKRDPATTDHLWWYTLVELRDEEGLNVSVLGIPLPY